MSDKDLFWDEAFRILLAIMTPDLAAARADEAVALRDGREYRLELAEVKRVVDKYVTVSKPELLRCLADLDRRRVETAIFILVYRNDLDVETTDDGTVRFSREIPF